MTGMDEIGIVFLTLLVTVKVFQYDVWGENSMRKVEIRVKGGLDEHWSEWFQDFEVMPGEKDETILVGEVVDQAALYGLIAKLRDLGLTLIAVNEI
jgi:hypothetical protein